MHNLVTEWAVRYSLRKLWNKNPELWYGYFNNWIAHLPNPNYLHGSLYRKMRIDSGNWDTRYEKFSGDGKGNSRLLLTQTPSQFYMVVDWTITSQKIDIPTMHRHMRGIGERGNNSTDDRKDLLWLLVPVFLHLRAIGYSHDDLTS